MWRRRQCQSDDSKIVRGFRVVCVSREVGGLCSTVLAALGEAVWGEPVVDLVECAIDGTAVCAVNECMVVCALDDGTVGCAFDYGSVISVLDDALFHFFFLQEEFLNMLRTVQVSAVVGDMI